MRLAIISDTHMPRGARRLPDACVERLRAADAILHCGDFMRAEVVDAIAGIGPPLHAVHGNVDDAAVSRRLPARLQVELGGRTFGLVHDPGPARGRLQRLRSWFPAADAVLFGHTHMPEHAQDCEGFQIFNPGSPTERRRAPAHTMGAATIEDGELIFELIVVTA